MSAPTNGPAPVPALPAEGSPMPPSRGLRRPFRGRMRPVRRLAATLALVLVATLAATGPAAAAGSTASATDRPAGARALAKASAFTPGNIITDEVFFNGGALSAGQVQAFLNAQVPTCLAKKGNPTCLRSYRMTTPTRKADAYCTAYKGAKNERASTIIAKVAKACGVSAKALLVIMQKEQSLVTSTAPTAYKYERAMGFACPDTAPCNEVYFGLFNQTYAAARQYQRYADRSVYGWRNLGVNTLTYHPDSSRKCGTVAVDIKNQATLGLYFYTPYVPNAAALANMYGTGDRCSSYGNRNFWRGFTDWFGSTKIAVTGTVQKHWLAKGGLNGSLGVQRARVACKAGTAYCAQRFSGGTVATSPAVKAGFTVTGVMHSQWRARGSQTGVLGWPYSAQGCRKADSSCQQRFSTGYVVDSERYGTKIVTGKVATKWRGAGGRSGTLGLPSAQMSCSGKARTTCSQRFAKGYVSTHASRGTHTVVGAMATYWGKKKRHVGSLGSASSKATCAKSKGVTTCRQSFGASTKVVTSTKYPTTQVKGSILKAWDKKRSTIGNPMKNRSCKTQGKGSKKVTTCSQRFTKGWVTASTKYGTYRVTGKFGTAYTKARGKLGPATSNRSCKTQGKGSKKVRTCTQKFAKGTIVQKGAKSPKVSYRKS